jgi:hypothetical protein
MVVVVDHFLIIIRPYLPPPLPSLSLSLSRTSSSCRYLLNFVRKYFSLAVASLGGLVVYITPTDEDLRKFQVSTVTSKKDSKEAASKQAHSQRFRKGGGFASAASSAVAKESQELLIDRSAPIVLESRAVQPSDLTEDYIYDIYYEILVNFLVGGMVLWGLSEGLLLVLGPLDWIIDGKGFIFAFMGTAAGFTLIAMLRLTLDFAMLGDINDGMITVIVAFTSFLVSMGILMNSETFFDFELDRGYADVAARCTALLKEHKLEESPVSLKTVKLFVALACGGLGGVLLFPTLRFIRSQVGAQKYTESGTSSWLWLQLNVISLVLVTCSFTQLAREQLELSAESMVTVRAGLFFLVVLARLFTFRLHMYSVRFLSFDLAWFGLSDAVHAVGAPPPHACWLDCYIVRVTVHNSRLARAHTLTLVVLIPSFPMASQTLQAKLLECCP